MTSSSGPATEAGTSTLSKVQAKPSQSLELEFAPSSELDCPAFELTELYSVVGKLSNFFNKIPGLNMLQDQSILTLRQT